MPLHLPVNTTADAADRYLDLLKAVLTRSLFMSDETFLVLRPEATGWKRRALAAAQRLLARANWTIVSLDSRLELRRQGRDWPDVAETMVGLARLDNVQACVETVLADGVPGDLIETGVWRGGTTILMRAVLAAHQVIDRTVWVADSFQGLPAPDLARYPADAGIDLNTYEQLAVPVEAVQENFRRYGLLDEQVRFLPGWFRDTLPDAPIEQLAVLRLDGDMYESTWEAITALYPKVAPGGFVIVDDYLIPACRQAVNEYREQHAITEPIETIDHTGVFWRRAA
jgi:O-methyltransferase